MNANKDQSQTTLLLVDDDEVDQEAVRRALGRAGLSNPVVVACDGIQALQMLRGEGGYVPLPSPYMILLDLNMPRMNGFEFLSALRGDPDHRHAVVFVLTTSLRDQDKVRAYELNVAGYISKATAAQDLSLLARLIDTYSRLIEFDV